jgi:class 3 adenylate cyclase
VRATDVTAEAPSVRAETLILSPAGAGLSPGPAQDTASLIPDATLRFIEQDTAYINRESLPALMSFFGVSAGANASQATIGGTATILFTDVADSTAWTEQIGDAEFHERARTLGGSLRDIARRHGGAVIDATTLGDGMLVTFPAAAQAIRAALECARAAEDAGLPLHVGLHAGDVIREEDNVYGGAVNIASRVCALCAPGEVLVSGTVRDLARTSAGVAFEDRGLFDLKGIEEPQRIFLVRPG